MVGIWYPVCHIHMTVQLVTSLMTPAQTYQCPYCLPQPLLGLGDKRQQEKKETWLPNQHSLSFGQQMKSFWNVGESSVPVSGSFTEREKHKLPQLSSGYYFCRNKAMSSSPSLSSWRDSSKAYVTMFWLQNNKQSGSFPTRLQTKQTDRNIRH